MEIISKLFSVTLAVFQLPITIFGYTFSFWQVFCFSVVAGIVGYILGGFLSGD